MPLTMVTIVPISGMDVVGSMPGASDQKRRSQSTFLLSFLAFSPTAKPNGLLEPSISIRSEDAPLIMVAIVPISGMDVIGSKRTYNAASALTAMFLSRALAATAC